MRPDQAEAPEQGTYIARHWAQAKTYIKANSYLVVIVYPPTRLCTMEPEGSDPYRGAKPSYLDQPAFNYTPSQAATSYAGSMSGERNHGFNHDDDDAQSKASTYTSYTVDSSRQVKRERGRVSVALILPWSLKIDFKGLQPAERYLHTPYWYDQLPPKEKN